MAARADLLAPAAAPEAAPLDGGVQLLPAVLRRPIGGLRAKLDREVAWGGSEGRGELGGVI